MWEGARELTLNISINQEIIIQQEYRMKPKSIVWWIFCLNKLNLIIAIKIRPIVWTVWDNFHTSEIHLTRIFLSRIDQHEWHKYFFGVKLWILTCKFVWNCEFSRVNSCEIFTYVIEIVQTIGLLCIVT